VVTPGLVPDSLKYLWSETIKPVSEPIAVLSTSIAPTKPKTTPIEKPVTLKVNKEPAKETVIVKQPETTQPKIESDTKPVTPELAPVKTVPVVIEKPITQPVITAAIEKPAVTTSVPSSDIYYKIQIGSYPAATNFDGLEQLGEITESIAYGNHIYRAGRFDDVNEAKKQLEWVRQKGYSLAFILQYNKDKVISIIK
jgi:hypothetical protein